MKVSVGFSYINKIFNAAKETSLKDASLEKIADNIAKTGSEIMSEQNRVLILKKAPNYVEPLKKEFKSTKEMFAYARKRCLDGNKQNYEHIVVMDTKQNKVIAEFKGDAKSCNIAALKEVEFDAENTAIMHGHPINYPLSYNDICCMKNYNISQIIAIDDVGEFSLVYRKPTQKSETKGLKNWYLNRKEKKRLEREFVTYSVNAAEDYEFSGNNPELYKKSIDYTLRTNMPKINMRYVTNYKYLVEEHKKHKMLQEGHSPFIIPR